jgi:hypothetical protein
MAKSLLSQQDIRKINNLIITWEGNLTWENLVLAIKSTLGITISRQSLSKYDEVKYEFNRRKQLKRGVVTEAPVTYAEGSTINQLKKTIERLEAENELLARKYNAAELFLSRAIKNGREMGINLEALLAEHSDESTLLE